MSCVLKGKRNRGTKAEWIPTVSVMQAGGLPNGLGLCVSPPAGPVAPALETQLDFDSTRNLLLRE